MPPQCGLRSPPSGQLLACRTQPPTPEMGRDRMKPATTLAAEKKVKEILGEIYYDTNSLTHALIKAVRGGMEPASGRMAIRLIQSALEDAALAYDTAIAQPEIKQAVRPVVEL
jgi:hypothetical protein